MHLVRGYFALDGHHLPFKVATAQTLREAQAHPEQYRDLIVRVTGYSDYFCDLTKPLHTNVPSAATGRRRSGQRAGLREPHTPEASARWACCAASRS